MRTRFRRPAIAAAITLTTLVAASPAWAAFPDQGNRILYVRQRASSPARGVAANDMFSIKNNGDDRVRISDSPRINEYGGFFSPNGARIVYWGQTPDAYQVFRANADGSGREALTSNPISVNPNWSRNGSRIVYVKYSGPATPSLGGPFTAEPRGPGSVDLMIMNSDGTGKHSILNGSGIYSPGWSPTAAEIGFSGTSGDGLGLFLISPEGGEPQIVCCKIGGTALFADWSPDGRRLLFVFLPPTTGPSTVFEVWTIRRNGTDAVLLTDESYNVTLPRYSDDGERVIFAKDVGGGDLDLYSIRSDGSGGKKRLTDTPAANEWLNYVIG